MSFRVAQKTLERLEWPQVVARLRDHCRTSQARRNLAQAEARDGGDDLDPVGFHFESELSGARARLGETSEARRLLEAGEIPPLSTLADLEVPFQRAAKEGVLTPHQLLDIGSALCSLHATVRFLKSHASPAPLLATIALQIEDHRELEREIESCVDTSGEVCDGASAALREARGEAQRLSGMLKDRLARQLQDPNVAAALSDVYYTLRNDRFVLPVRADARGRIKGIVHDASNSGATLFIEPEALVELNNQLKQAELSALREALRVLRNLSRRVAESVPSLRVGLAALTAVDLAFARGRLSMEMDAVEPQVGRDGVFELLQLRHPLLPREAAVPNDMRLGESFCVMVISGPNGGGKTVAMKAVALAALFARAGLHVPAASGARVCLVDQILADIGDDQDIRESLSTFSAHMANVARIVEAASEHTLVVLDEVGVGTDPNEGAALAQAVLERLAQRGARVIATTHYNLLKEMAAIDSRFCNASVEFDPDTLAPTFRLRLGEPGVSSATAVAARMGMPKRVLERANTLLESEDRRLDRMLSELASTRASLEAEQREAVQLRAEGEAARDEYRARLERLQERRDKLFLSMREDLDHAFKEAHSHVAAVIRDLQRGGGARDAARARARLLTLDEQTRAAAESAGVSHREDKDRAQGDAVDWRHAAPGDPVVVPGGRPGRLESLPDRRGKVRVRVGGATLVLACDRLATAGQEAGAGRAERRPERSRRSRGRDFGDAATVADAVGGGTLRCDLRGQRVEEAMDCVDDALDRAARENRDGLVIVHGLGTGALRRAVREHLSASPYVGRISPGGAEQGGDGVTLAELRR